MDCGASQMPKAGTHKRTEMRKDPQSSFPTDRNGKKAAKGIIKYFIGCCRLFHSRCTSVKKVAAVLILT